MPIKIIERVCNVKTILIIILNIKEVIKTKINNVTIDKEKAKFTFF
jgi:hypothetical protein